MDKRWLFTSKETFRFFVGACRDASLVIATIPFYKVDQASEIILGANNNKETRIFPDRSNQEDYQIAETPNILDCDTLREFWISWDGGILRVGRGKEYDDELLSVSYSWLNISAIALTTGNDVYGRWVFFKKEGLCK